MTNLKDAIDNPDELEQAAEEDRKRKQAEARRKRREATKYGSMLETGE